MYHRLGRLCGGVLVLAALASAGAALGASGTRNSSFKYHSASGLLNKEIVEAASSDLCLVIDYTLDAYGNRIAATRRNCSGTSGEAAAPSGLAVFASRTSSTGYDARGRFPLTTTNALNDTETRVYDAKTGQVTSLTGPNGLITTWQYDGLGRKTLEIRPDGNRTKWEYLYCSGVNGGTAACPAHAKYLVQETPLPASGTTPNGPWKKTYFDVLGREIRGETQGFDGATIAKSTEYDAKGRVLRVSRPYYSGQTVYWATFGYEDTLNRVTSETAPDNSQTTIAYNGLTTITTNALGQTLTKVRNSQDQIVSVTDAAGKTIAYQYDPFGNLTRTTDTLGNQTFLTYDLRGRKAAMSDPDMGGWSYAYNALGELVRQTDAKAQIVTMAYDKLGRMVSRSEPDLVSNWYYDKYADGSACSKGIGKLCEARTASGYIRKHTFDALGRPDYTYTTFDNTVYTTRVGYDEHGRVGTQDWPTGFSVKYAYTPLGYLKTVRKNDSSNALYWRADTMDAEGHLLQQTYGNNVVTQQSYATTTGRLQNILSGTGNVVQNLAYAHDSLGNLTGRNDPNQNLVETFTYDNRNRLSFSYVDTGAGAVNKAYGYNAIGNLTSRSDLGTYTYNASGAGSVRPHAVAEVALAAGGKRQFSYDANGNLTLDKQFDAANNEIVARRRTHGYTSFNMPATLGGAGISLAFAYGPEHQRMRQVAPAATTFYLHPDNTGGLAYEKDTRPDASVEHRHFITAGGQVVALVKQAGSSGPLVVRYLHRDHLGSTTALTDEAGAIVERLSYEPFGKRRLVSGLDDTNNTIVGVNTDRGYTNHEHLEELGLVLTCPRL